MPREARDTLTWDFARQGWGPGLFVMRVDQHAGMRPHDHLFHELVFIEQGSAIHHTASGQQPLRPGDVIVIRPHVWHQYTDAQDMTIVNCLFHSRLLGQLGQLHGGDGVLELFSRRVSRQNDEPPLVLHARPAVCESLQAAADRILREQDKKAPGWRLAATAKLLEVLVTVARLHQQAPLDDDSDTARLTSRTEQAVLDTVSHLEAHYDRDVTLDGLASKVHVSSAHLSRKFRERMGMGVVAFLHRLRAEEACRLLSTTDLSVTEIASAVGYDEPAYFSRCFRKAIGRSPRDYRSQAAGDAPSLQPWS